MLHEHLRQLVEFLLFGAHHRLYECILHRVWSVSQLQGRIKKRRDRVQKLSNNKSLFTIREENGMCSTHNIQNHDLEVFAGISFKGYLLHTSIWHIWSALGGFMSVESWAAHGEVRKSLMEKHIKRKHFCPQSHSMAVVCCLLMKPQWSLYSYCRDYLFSDTGAS